MSQGDRYRSRFQPKNLPKYFQDNSGLTIARHEHLHRPKTLVYTGTLATGTTSTPFYTPFPGKFVRGKVGVTAAGASDTEIDFLINGRSVFESADEPYLVVVAGETQSEYRYFTYLRLIPTDKLELNSVDDGGATAPFTIYLDFYSEPEV